MSLLTILWSMLAGAVLTLALVHAMRWLSDRSARANLTFSIVAVAVASMVPIELHLMQATTTEDYGTWVRWFQVPIFVVVTGTVLFIGLYMGTGRWWLAWTIVALRVVILIASFVSEPNFNFSGIHSLERVQFLGEEVSVIGYSAVGAWQWLAATSLALMIVYVIDAMLRLWRTGDRDARTKVVLVGGGVLTFALIAIIQTQSVVWGIRQAPLFVSPQFLIMFFAMSFELSRDLLRAARLAGELHETELRLDLAAEAAGLGLWLLDVPSRSVLATEQVRAMYGFGDERPLTLQDWIDSIHPDDVGNVRRSMRRTLAREAEFAVEYRVRRADGSVRWISAHGRAQPGADRRPAVVRGVLRDITEAKLAREETEVLRRELAHAGRVTLLGQLSASLAHELNQPLGAILRNAEAAEMLLQVPAPDLEEIRAIIADIRRDDQRAGDVIERLRALLKRRSVELQPLSIDSVIQDVVELVRSDAAARLVSIEFAAPSDLPLALGDRVHLSQVLLNLIVNALDAVSDVALGSRRVSIRVQRADDAMLEVSVHDSGPGIAPDVAARIFEPFYSTKNHGMGMGLPISRTIVDAHGGRLWVDSDGRGATFRFTVPVALETVA